jgi:hypothetical protein
MTIVSRSGAKHWAGRLLPPDVAYIVNGVPVTWSQVMENRRRRQAEILRRKRHVEEWRAVKLWVAYFDQSLMGGWHAFLDGISRWRVWIDRDRPWCRKALMDLFPVVEPGLFDEESYFPHCPLWERWKVEFAMRYRRRTQDRRPVGVAYLWRRGDELRLQPQ